MAKATLTSHERQTIIGALSVAAERYDADAAEFGKLAKHLREGKTFPMFAEGAPGARAADCVQEQFERQARDARAVANRIDTFDDVVLVAETES